METLNDKVGKEIVKKIFQSKKINLENSTGQYCYYDLSSYVGNDFLIIEVKNRNKNSTDYYDNFCEFKKLQNNRQISKYALLISIYNDDIYRITPLSSTNYTVEKKWCPETTDFNRTKYVLKDCAVFKDFKDHNLSSLGISKAQIRKDIYGY